MEHEGQGAVKSIGESTVAEATYFSPSQVLVNKHILKKKKVKHWSFLHLNPELKADYI